MLIIATCAILLQLAMPASGQGFWNNANMNRYNPIPQNNFANMNAAQRNIADMNRQAQAQARYHFVNADMNRPAQNNFAAAIPAQKSALLRDNQIKGGEKLRSLDVEWSQKYGGYHSNEPGKTLYGKYGEPVLHALEHLRRAVVDRNPVELARVKDELLIVGKGLHTCDHKYLREAIKKTFEEKE